MRYGYLFGNYSKKQHNLWDCAVTFKIGRRLDVEYGTHISTGRVYRLMKSMNLPKMSTAKPAFQSIKSDANIPCANILNQQFNTAKPNFVLVSDITFVRVNGVFHYICVIIDLFSRKVVSYSVSRSIDTNLVLNIFSSAYEKRNRPDNLIFHSDHGSQYTSKKFRDLLDSLNVVQSFSAKGYPYDNVAAESFSKYLKREELNRKTYSTMNQLELSLFEYIESFYNSKRPHFANNMSSPNEKEKLFYN